MVTRMLALAFYNESVFCDVNHFYPLSKLVISSMWLGGKILRKFCILLEPLIFKSMASSSFRRLLFINRLKWANFGRSELINRKSFVKHFD